MKEVNFQYCSSVQETEVKTIPKSGICSQLSQVLQQKAMP